MNEESSTEYQPPEIDLRRASFPSDTLSIKRLRVVFPGRFDSADTIVDGYTRNDFFLPVAAEQPTHLLHLAQMICDERTVAAAAFQVSLPSPAVLSQEEQAAVANAKSRLESTYQQFRLASDAETARLLIQQVEEEGQHQARSQAGHSR